MELKDNTKNISSEDIMLPWGRFKYTIKAGESKFFPQNVLDAMTKRYPDAIRAIAIDEEAPSESQETLEGIVEEAVEEAVEETLEELKEEKKDKKGGK